jgi:two-component system chemotaxis response regulator CheY
MGWNVLIVDDAVSVRWLVGKVFRQNGFHVFEAVNGLEGLKTLAANKIDLILVDLNMPEMNGMEFMTKVKLNPVYNGIPVIIISGESNPQLLEIAKQSGAAGWIIKPFNPEILVDNIRDLVPTLFNDENGT